MPAWGAGPVSRRVPVIGHGAQWWDGGAGRRAAQGPWQWAKGCRRWHRRSQAEQQGSHASMVLVPTLPHDPQRTRGAPSALGLAEPQP